MSRNRRDTDLPKPVRALLWSLASAALAIVIYEGLRVTGVLPKEYFPSITSIAAAFVQEAATASFWAAIWDTVRDTGLGVIIALIVGVPLGVALGINPLVYRLTRFPVEFLRPVPAVAVIPLFVLITGSGSPTKIALAGLSAFFPILLQTILGVRDVDPTAVQTAKAFQLSWARQFFQIILPWSAPFIVTGLRIASTLALLVTVSTEIIVGAPGLGRAIMLSQNAGLEDVMYVYIIVAGLIGVIINMLLSALETKLLAWTPAQREDSK